MTKFEIDFPFTFGDLICYRYEPGTVHDGALMYVAPCSHPARDVVGKYLIDILDVAGDGHIEHKDPVMWRRCDHLAKWAPAIREVSGTFEGTIEGRIDWLLGNET